VGDQGCHLWKWGVCQVWLYVANNSVNAKSVVLEDKEAVGQGLWLVSLVEK